MNDRERALLRDALRRATPAEPDVERLVEAVPALLARAERERRLAATPAARLADAGSTWLPRLALATCVLALAALLWPAGKSGRAVRSDAASALDAWVVSGEPSTRIGDPVLDAIVR